MAFGGICLFAQMMLFYSGDLIAGRPRSTQFIRFDNPLRCWSRRKFWSDLPDRRPDTDVIEYRTCLFSPDQSGLVASPAMSVVGHEPEYLR